MSKQNQPLKDKLSLALADEDEPNEDELDSQGRVSDHLQQTSNSGFNISTPSAQRKKVAKMVDSLRRTVTTTNKKNLDQQKQIPTHNNNNNEEPLNNQMRGGFDEHLHHLPLNAAQGYSKISEADQFEEQSNLKLSLPHQGSQKEGDIHHIPNKQATNSETNTKYTSNPMSNTTANRPLQVQIHKTKDLSRNSQGVSGIQNLDVSHSIHIQQHQLQQVNQDGPMYPPLINHPPIMNSASKHQSSSKGFETAGFRLPQMSAALDDQQFHQRTLQQQSSLSHLAAGGHQHNQFNNTMQYDAHLMANAGSHDVAQADLSLLQIVKKQKKMLREFPGHQSVVGLPPQGPSLNHTYSLGGLVPMQQLLNDNEFNTNSRAQNNFFGKSFLGNPLQQTLRPNMDNSQSHFLLQNNARNASSFSNAVDHGAPQAQTQIQKPESNEQSSQEEQVSTFMKQSVKAGTAGKKQPVKIKKSQFSRAGPGISSEDQSIKTLHNLYQPIEPNPKELTLLFFKQFGVDGHHESKREMKQQNNTNSNQLIAPEPKKDHLTSANFPDCLKGHNLKPRHRAQMVDWMIQVFRVLQRSNDRTFFLAISILDRFFTAQQSFGHSLGKSELHLFGLVSCWIASKLEDRRPIRMHEVINEAGHGKFQKDKILTAELVLSQSINYKLVDNNLLIDEIIIALRYLIPARDLNSNPPSSECDMELVATFVAKALVHDVKLSSLPIPIQVYTVLIVAIDLYNELLNLKLFRPELAPQYQLSENDYQSKDPHNNIFNEEMAYNNQYGGGNFIYGGAGIHLRTQQLNKEQIKEMMTKLLADIKEGGKIASLTNIDERIYNKAISRLKTLIRDSLVRYKQQQTQGGEGGNPNDDNSIIIIRNLMKSYTMLIDPIINKPGHQIVPGESLHSQHNE